MYFKEFILACFIVFAFACTSNVDPIVMADAEPIMLKANQQKRVAQDNAFAFELLKQTNKANDKVNIMVSPLSVSIALGMTRNGAVSETLEGIEKALFLSGLTDDEINEYYQIMQQSLPKVDPSTQLNIANSIWYREGFEVKSDFLNINKKYFDATVRQLDFSKPGAKDSINNWCAKKTDGLIDNILDNIPGDAVMYLVNAVYFKGIWTKKFDKKNTAERNFLALDKKNVQVPIMYAKDTFACANTTLADVVELNYGNKAFSMILMLPNAQSDANELVAALNTDIYSQILAQLQTEEVELYLPRLAFKTKLLLNDPLKTMGMEKAFEDRNEFSRITDHSIFVSRVLHDTFIELNEEGTRAAAATVVEMREKAMLNKVFNFNRPFVFLIREKSTGVIVFAGKVGNPADQ